MEPSESRYMRFSSAKRSNGVCFVLVRKPKRVLCDNSQRCACGGSCSRLPLQNPHIACDHRSAPPCCVPSTFRPHSLRRRLLRFAQPLFVKSQATPALLLQLSAEPCFELFRRLLRQCSLYYTSTEEPVFVEQLDPSLSSQENLMLRILLHRHLPYLFSLP